MINSNLNLKVVRASAWYDLVVTAMFMTPWSAALAFNGLAVLSQVLSLNRPVPVLDATSMLLANLMGSVVVIWSLWRLRQPNRLVGLYDALARGLFAIWQLYAVSHGASLLLLGFTLMELTFCIAQCWPVHPTGGAED